MATAHSGWWCCYKTQNCTGNLLSKHSNGPWNHPSSSFQDLKIIGGDLSGTLGNDLNCSIIPPQRFLSNICFSTTLITQPQRLFFPEQFSIVQHVKPLCTQRSYSYFLGLYSSTAKPWTKTMKTPVLSVDAGSSQPVGPEYFREEAHFASLCLCCLMPPVAFLGWKGITLSSALLIRWLSS